MNPMRSYDVTGLGELVCQIRHGGTAQAVVLIPLEPIREVTIQVE